MRKLSLSLEELKVDSFDTAGEERRGGTVHGHGLGTGGSQETIAGTGDMSCDTCQTCDESMCDSCWFVTCGAAEA